MFHVKHGRASFRVDMVSFLKLALYGFIPNCARSLGTYVEKSCYRRGAVLMAKLEQGPAGALWPVPTPAIACQHANISFIHAAG